MSDDELEGFVTLKTFKKRVKKLGWELDSLTEPTSVSPESLSAYLKAGQGGCESKTNISLTSYSPKFFATNLPMVTHLDDERGLKVTSAKKEVIDLLTPKLPAVTKDLASLQTLAKGTGMKLEALPVPPPESGDTMLHIEKAGLGDGTIYHYAYAGLNGKNGYATKRHEDWVLTVHCFVGFQEPDEKPNKAAATMMKKLTK